MDRCKATKDVFAANVDRNQTTQNVQSDLQFNLSTLKAYPHMSNLENINMVLFPE